MKFKFIKQQDQRDSGAVCVQMITKHYGRNYHIQSLRSLCKTTKYGISISGIEDGLVKLGLQPEKCTLDIKELKEIMLPIILNWRLSHYVVLYRVHRNKFYIADPARGKITFTEGQFQEVWYSRKEFGGICIKVAKSPTFEKLVIIEGALQNHWIKKLKSFTEYTPLLYQLVLGFLFGSFFQLITPFFTQSIVDQGINGQDINLVYIILIAQLVFFLSNTAVNFIRSWILLGISAKINMVLLTEFLYKMMKLPISFFATKTSGDLMQRMNDQQKIESFLTGTALNTLFSTFNLILFSIVLANYSISVFWIFVCSTLLYSLWISLFLKPKRLLNYLQFENAAINQNNIIELIDGIQDIKLTQSEKQKRWKWENLQVNLYKYKIKILKINQLQNAGSVFINQGKTILITFLSVRAVISGELTLGGMMAIQYIIGQVNNPVEQILNFMQSFQEAKISMERLNDIHNTEDEEERVGLEYDFPILQGDIIFSDVSFSYPVSGIRPALKNISLTIPYGKKTAIVGMSGSGKTTLLKLLLRFHQPDQGSINIGSKSLEAYSYQAWRRLCGTVLSDAYVFSDTIQNNITLGDPHPTKERVDRAINIANLGELIENLPSGLDTQVGPKGNTLSLGQKQRLLIARTVYRNPEYIFFDEATNALDSVNEEIINDNLRTYFQGKTIVTIAHRLNTVRDSDQIIVIDKSEVAESGTHDELIKHEGIYFNLVKNQLALGA